MIAFSGVGFSYRRDRPVLSDVDLELTPGLELLVGPNGCGKSTLVRLAAGVESPDGGRITVDGCDLWTEEVAARRRLAYLPEQPDLSPYATVGEVLDLVCRLRAAPRDEGREALDRVGLSGLARRTVRELSLGQRRRALLAAAFVRTPGNVLLDEPLEAMDGTARRAILEWVAGLVEAGQTVVVVSHELEPFFEITHRALTVRGARVARLPWSPSSPSYRARLEETARGAGSWPGPSAPGS